VSRLISRVLPSALLLQASCDTLLVDPAPRGASIALELTPAAMQAVAAGGSRQAFDAADSVRMVLVDAALFTGDPFSATGRVMDVTLPFVPADTVGLSLELKDDGSVPPELVLGLMLKEHGSALFVFVDSITVTSGQTTRVPVPLLFPVPASIQLRVDKDSLLLPVDSTRVWAVGLFATGDTIPDGQFFPDFVAPDGNLAVSDNGTSALVRPGSTAGSWRVVARANGIGGDPTDTVTIRVVTPPAPVAFVQVATGQDYACGLTGAGKIYCWGKNTDAVFGNGTSTSSATPVLAGGGFDYVRIAPGFDHMCALKSNGVIACWGNNDFGQLGDSTNLSALFPRPVKGGPYTQLSVGALHSCAIDALQVLRCWGYNADGELGTGAAGGFSTYPQVVTGARQWSAVSAGGFGTCGIVTGAMARCWGRNIRGMLGRGDTVSSATPVLVDSVAGHTWTMISMGGSHVCAVETGTQDIFCWGDNVSNQLGLSTGADAVDHPTPLRVATGFAPLALSSGERSTCIVPGSGSYYCWGDNSQGQLGGTDPTGGTWTGISSSTGVGFTCGLQTSGSIWCWGDNNYGQLGNGGTADSPVPVQVLPPGGVGGSLSPVIPGGTR
jgi:alpha-tubulin suppressor-like RCC1 family protein